MDLLNAFLLLAFFALIPTAYAAKIGAPYVPTFTRALEAAFNFISLGPGDTLIDLGAGDGKIVLRAARRGALAIGYELSPIMWLIGALRALPVQRARVRYGNFYKRSLSSATVVFAFLMPQNMDRVRRYLAKQVIPNGKFFLSYTFPFKGIEPLHVVREPKCGPVYIYNLQELTQRENEKRKTESAKQQRTNKKL
jgi:hypothetical protein